MTAQPVREGVGRRKEDIECAAHEERMDSIERKLSWQKGAMYIASGCLTFGLALFGWMGNAIYAKVTTIELMLNKSEITSTILVEQVKGIDKRVQAIEDRHIYEQQTGVRK